MPARTQRIQVELSARDAASRVLGGFSNTLKNVTRAAAPFTGVLLGGAAVGMAMVGVAKAVRALAVEGTHLAAKNQMMATSMRVVGENAGWTQEQLTGAMEKVRSMGITTAFATKSVTSFIQSGLAQLAPSAEVAADQLAKLARTAQDLAVIAGTDSSQAFTTLNRAIGMTSPMLLRQFGIVDGLDAIYGKYAETVGKAARELTATEKRQAFMNRILEEGERVAGAYTAAMGDVAKQAGSMKRYIEEAKVAIGEAFLPIMQAGVKSQTAFWKSLRKLAQDIKPDLELLSKTFAESFGAIGSSIAETLGSAEFRANIKDFLGNIAKMIDWLSKLDPRVIAITTAFVGFLLIQGKLTRGIDKTIIAVIKAVDTFNVTLALNPWVLVAAAIVAVTLALIELEKKTKEMVKGRDEEIAGLVKTTRTYDEYVEKSREAAMAISTGYERAAIKTMNAEQLIAQGIIKNEPLWKAMRGELELTTQSMRDAGYMMRKLTQFEEEFAATQEPMILAEPFTDWQAAFEAAIPQMVDSAKTVFGAMLEAGREAGAALSQIFATEAMTNQFIEMNALVAQGAADMNAVLMTSGEERAAILSESTGMLGAIQQQFNEQTAESEFQRTLAIEQAEQEFQARFAALMDVGRKDEAAKLGGKFKEQQGMSERSYKIQQQLQERSMLQAQAQRAAAYVIELQQMRDQTLRVMAEEMIKWAAQDESRAGALNQGLTAIANAGSEQLRVEILAKEASINASQLWADKTLDAQQAVAQGLAILATAEKDAAGAAEKLKKEAAAFKVELPPMPKLDISAITGAGPSIKSAAARATEPATAKLVDVVEDINKGIDLALDAISKMADFELPVGVEAGFAALNDFLVTVFSMLHRSMEGIDRDTSKLYKRMAKSISKIIDSFQIFMSLESMFETRPNVESIRLWAEGFEQLVRHILDAAQRVLDDLGGGKRGYENVKLLQKVTRKMQKMLEATAIDFEKLSVQELPDMQVWKAQIIEVTWEVFQTVQDLRKLIKDRDLADAASKVDLLKKLVELVNVDFSEMSVVKLPDLDSWKTMFVSAIIKGVRAIQDVVKEIGGFNLQQAASQVGNLTSVLEIMTFELAKIKPAPGDFTANALAAVEQIKSLAVQLLSWLTGIDDDVAKDIVKAADVASNMTKLFGILGVDLSKIKMPEMDFMVFSHNADEYILRLRQLVDRIKNWLGKLEPETKAEIKLAADVASNVTKLFSLLGVDFSKVVPTGAGFETFLTSYIESMKLATIKLVEGIKSIQETIKTEGALAAAAEAAKDVKAVLDLLGIGGMFADMKDVGKIDVTRFVNQYVDKMKEAVAIMVPALEQIKKDWGAGLISVKDVAQNIAEVTKLLMEIATNIDKAWAAGTINVPILAMLMRQMQMAGALISTGGLPPGTVAAPVAPPGEVGAVAAAPAEPASLGTFTIRGEFVVNGEKVDFTKEVEFAEDNDINLGQITIPSYAY